MNNPLVSVIIPVFNGQSFIAEAINSVLNQTYTNLEIIVINDGSTDNTAKILESYGDNIIYRYQENSGTPSSPRNTGMKIAKGEYVTFLDSDDIYKPDKIQRQIEMFEKFPNISVSMCNYVNFSNHTISDTTAFQACPAISKYLGQNSQAVVDKDLAREILTNENFTSMVGLMVKKEVVDEVGHFNENLQASVDFDLIYRLCLKHDMGLINEIGFMRRKHNNNLSSNPEKVITYKIKCRKKLLDLETNPKIKSKIKTFISGCYLSLSQQYLKSHCGKSYISLLYSIRYLPTRYHIIVFIKITLILFRLRQRPQL